MVSYLKAEMKRHWSGCILDVVVKGDPAHAQSRAEVVVQEIDHES